MPQAAFTRLINWCAIAIAVALLLLVTFHIYKKHIQTADTQGDYRFNDLPTKGEAPVTGDIDQIIAAHIMGVVPTVAVNKPVVKKPPPKPVAPKSKLNILLTGVIDGATPQSGYAMIELKRGKTAVIGVGERIGDTGAVLNQVLPGEVLVERDGTIESIKMVRNTLDLAQQMPDQSLIDLLDNPNQPRAANQTSSSTQSQVNQELRYQEQQYQEQQYPEDSYQGHDVYPKPGTGRPLPIPRKLLRL